MNLKKIFQIIGVSLIGSMLLFAACEMYIVDGSVDLKTAPHLTGEVTASYETIRHTSGRGSSSSAVFAFRIKSYPHVLGAYRPNHDYSGLKKEIARGDTITVIFRPRKNQAINIDVYQIEKHGKIVLDYATYRRNHIWLAVFLFVLGVVMLYYGIRSILGNNE